MKFVINSDGLLVSADDISLGVHRSSTYLCPDCDESVEYVSPSNRCCAYFRHRPESRCNADNDRHSGTYVNKMSEFHKNWQNIFPKKCLEIKFGNNRADIYLETDKDFNLTDTLEFKIFDDFEPKNLVIEIQNSKISQDDLSQRQQVYKCETLERQLLWIFNLLQCQVEIRYNKTTKEYQLKFKGGDTSFMNLLNIKESKACILLDNGGTNLYHVSNNPKCDREFISVSIVDRIQLLEQLSNIFNLDLKWDHNMKKDIIIEFDPSIIISKPIPKVFDKPQISKSTISRNWFNDRWLEMFNDIEHGLDNVYLKVENPFNLVDNSGEKIFKTFEPVNLKLQFDKLLWPTCIATETRKIRQDSEQKTDILWVVNLSGYEHDIEYVKTYAEEKYLVRFKNDNRILCQLKSTKSKINIMFDTSGKDLYYALDTSLISGNSIQVLMIDRLKLLEQLNSVFKLNLKWAHDMEIDDIEKYDYESLISSANFFNDTDIRRCFYLMELNPEYIFDYQEYWKRYRFLSIGRTLNRLSNGNRQIMNIWIKWVMKNKPIYDDDFPFGKHSGTLLHEVPISYLKWAKEKCNNLDRYDDIDLYEKISFLCYFDWRILETEYSNSKDADCMGSLITLYRNIKGNKSWLPPKIPTPQIINTNYQINSFKSFPINNTGMEAIVKDHQAKLLNGC
jgi:hypothetical protein